MFSLSNCIFLIPSVLELFRDIFSLHYKHVFAFFHPDVDESIILLALSLSQKLRNQFRLELLIVKSGLSVDLVDAHFHFSPFSFFTCKISIFLSFLNFVHGSSVTKILNLAWWDALFLFLLLYSFIHRDELLNT